MYNILGACAHGREERVHLTAKKETAVHVAGRTGGVLTIEPSCLRDDARKNTNLKTAWRHIFRVYEKKKKNLKRDKNYFFYDSDIKATTSPPTTTIMIIITTANERPLNVKNVDPRPVLLVVCLLCMGETCVVDKTSKLAWMSCRCIYIYSHKDVHSRTCYGGSVLL